MKTIQYDYNDVQIKSIAVDETNKRTWIAFTPSNGSCRLICADGTNLGGIYYDITLNVSEIVKLYVAGSYLYVLCNDSIVLFYRMSLVNPLTQTWTVNRPVGYLDEPSDILQSVANQTLVLLTGLLDPSATILFYNNALTLVSEIPLDTTGNIITNAASFVESGTSFWITTNNSPAEIIRLYDSGGYTYQTFIPSES